FLRHVQPVTHQMPIDRTRADLDRMIDFVQGLGLFQSGEKLAIQVRKLPAAKFEYTPYGVKEALDPILAETQGVEPVLRGTDADRILSIYLTADTMHL